MRLPSQDEPVIQAEPSLFESLWRHKWLILAAAVLAAIVGYGLSAIQPPVFTAAGSVLLTDPRGTAVYVDPFTAYIDQGRYVANEAEVFESRTVAVRASEMLGGDPDADEIQAVVSTDGEFEADLLTIHATQPTAQGAIDVVDAVVAAYEEIVTEQTQEASKNAVASLQNSKLELQVRIAETDQALGEHPDHAPLEAQRNAQLEQLYSLDTQIEQIAVNTALYGSGVRLYDSPNGAAQIAPRPLRNAAIAGVLGLIAAGAWAWWRDERDDRIESRNTPASVLDAPLLGSIPDFSSVDASAPVPTITNPQSTAAEAYHFVVSSLELALEHIDGKTIIVTSTGPEDGKTLTALNVAIAATGNDRRPLLIDADERTRGLSTLVKLGDAPGLTDITDNDGDPSDLIRPLKGSTKADLQFVPAGSTTAIDPARYFRSPAFRRALQNLISDQDLVLIDAPPILAVAETTDLTHQADGVLLVVRPGTSAQKLAEARDRIEMTGTPIIGYVYNRTTDNPKDATYGYGYGRPKTEAKS